MGERSETHHTRGDGSRFAHPSYNAINAINAIDFLVAAKTLLHA